MEDEAKDEDFYADIRRSRRNAKEDILDDTFRKAEISRGLRPKEKKKITIKPFLKLGIVLIFITVISLVVINYLPWMYVRYDAEYGTVQEFLDRDFKDGYHSEIDDIFESPCTNCSNNSKNYIGLVKDDFTNIPRTTTYGFIFLALLGIIFTIFEIVRIKRNFSDNIASINHSIFAAASAIVSIFVAMLLIKFLGLYILFFYNKSFVEASGVNNVIMICFVPIILIIISFVTLTIAIIVMKINFSEFEKKLKSERDESSYSTYRYGRGT